MFPLPEQRPPEGEFALGRASERAFAPVLVQDLSPPPRLFFAPSCGRSNVTDSCAKFGKLLLFAYSESELCNVANQRRDGSSSRRGNNRQRRRHRVRVQFAAHSLRSCAMMRASASLADRVAAHSHRARMSKRRTARRRPTFGTANCTRERWGSSQAAGGRLVRG